MPSGIARRRISCEKSPADGLARRRVPTCRRRARRRPRVRRQPVHGAPHRRRFRSGCGRCPASRAPRPPTWVAPAQARASDAGSTRSPCTTSAPRLARSDAFATWRAIARTGRPSARSTCTTRRPSTPVESDHEIIPKLFSASLLEQRLPVEDDGDRHPGVGGRAHDEPLAVGSHGEGTALIRALAALDARVDNYPRRADSRTPIPAWSPRRP